MVLVMASTEFGSLIGTRSVQYEGLWLVGELA